MDLYDYDEYLVWIINLIFDNFEIDVSYMSDEEFEQCLNVKFDKLEYREIDKELRSLKEKMMKKSVNIGDQISQLIGVLFPSRIDNYVKTVRSQKFFGRYMDDWYLMSPSKEELEDIYEGIKKIAAELGIFINEKKTHIVRMDGVYKYLQIKYSLTSTGKIIERINPKRVTALRRKLKKLKIQIDDGKSQYENVEGMFRGWMGSYYKILSNDQRLGLLKLFEDLYNKKIEVVKKKLIITDKI